MGYFRDAGNICSSVLILVRMLIVRDLDTDLETDPDLTFGND